MRTRRRYWTIADTHLGHDMLFKEGHRSEGFEEVILRNVSRDVGMDDVLIHFGDVSFYRHEYWHARLRQVVLGKMWLVLGNHDKKSTSWYLDQGWDFVGHEVVLKMYGHTIQCTHRPLDNFVDINVHGHLHSGEHRGGTQSDRHRLINIEHDLAPILLKHLIEG